MKPEKPWMLLVERDQQRRNEQAMLRLTFGSGKKSYEPDPRPIKKPKKGKK